MGMSLTGGGGPPALTVSRDVEEDLAFSCFAHLTLGKGSCRHHCAGQELEPLQGSGLNADTFIFVDFVSLGDMA